LHEALPRGFATLEGLISIDQNLLEIGASRGIPLPIDPMGFALLGVGERTREVVLHQELLGRGLLGGPKITPLHDRMQDGRCDLGVAHPS